MNELLLIGVFIGTMTVTSYRSVEAQTDSTPFITSTGEHVHSNGIALSRDLLKRWGGPVAYGDIVYVEGYGLKVVNDTMHHRHKNRVDLWVKTYEEEKNVGVRKGKLWLIKTREK
jgi:3D (Asp-Asp-Asp) domain-containing protein